MVEKPILRCCSWGDRTIIKFCQDGFGANEKYFGRTDHLHGRKQKWSQDRSKGNSSCRVEMAEIWTLWMQQETWDGVSYSNRGQFVNEDVMKATLRWRRRSHQELVGDLVVDGTKTQMELLVELKWWLNLRCKWKWNAQPANSNASHNILFFFAGVLFYRYVVHSVCTLLAPKCR